MIELTNTKSKHVQNLIIGFGKAGKTLAMELGNQGQEVILVEKDPTMYGGTCINVACIPTKKLVDMAERKPDDVDDATYYRTSIQEKKDLISKLNEGNYNNVNDTPNVTVVDGTASFVDDHTVKVEHNGNVQNFEADRIYINTGARPNVPNIEGLKIGGPIYTSETLLDLEELPNHLAIIGDGPIGLEFASIYRQFGARVTVLSHSPKGEFLKQYDRDMAELVLEALEDMGIDILFEADTTKVETVDNRVTLTYQQVDKSDELTAEAVLVATGRHANTADLNLEAAGVELGERGAIKVNDHLQTSQHHIFAMGDVKGGMQQTFISLDDYRIVLAYLSEKANYSLANRRYVPGTTFITPPISSVGLSEKEAEEQGFDYTVKKIAVESIPKAKLMKKTTGAYKAIVDNKTDQILGATLFGAESHEVIGILSTAMHGNLTASFMGSQIYSHPTMSEALNNLFG